MRSLWMSRPWLAVAVTVSCLAAACGPISALPVPGRTNTNQRPADSAPATAVPATPAPQIQAQPTALPPTPTVAASTVRTAPVRRGPISQTVQLDGRVAGLDEASVAFPQRSTPKKIDVKPGDVVSEGQVLVETDSTQIAQALRDARDALDSLVLQQQTRRQPQAAPASGQSDEVAASETLRKATAELAKVQAGPTDIEKQSADADVANAQAAIARAQADLDKAQNGANEADVRSAEQAVAAADLAFRQAEADAAKLAQGPDPEQVRAAERGLAAAQTAQVSAEADLDRLTQGPDQFQLRAAQREVDRAQSALTAAQQAQANASSSKSGDSGQSAAALNAAVVNAKLDLQAAQDALAKLTAPPRPEVVLAAQTKVDDAKAAVATAQEKLAVLRKGPDQLAIDKANAAVDSARTALQNAQSKLKDLKAGTSQSQIDTLAAALNGAQVSLASAQAKRDAVYARPTPDELRAAQSQVDIARAALDRVRQQNAPSITAQADDQAAQIQLNKAQQKVSDLQSELDATQLRSPIAGTVTSVLAQTSEPLEAGSAAVTIARPGDAAILVTLPRDSGNATRLGSQSDPSVRVAAGQTAQIQIDGGDGTQLSATVKSIVDGPGPGIRTAQLQVDWGSIAPAYGSTALVQLTVQQKSNALLIPVSAVRTAGGRKYVEYIDSSGARQSAGVQVGISTPTDVEITDGLTEGVSVVLNGPGPATAPNLTPVLPAPTAQARQTPASNSPPTGASLVAATPIPGTSPAGRAKLLLDESFLPDSTSQWLNNPVSTAWLADNAYHLRTVKQNQFTAVAAPLTAPMHDVDVSAAFRKTGGPPGGGYGIILRASDPSALNGTNQSGSYYVFEVGDSGQIGIWRRQDSRWIDLVPWTDSPAVNRDTGENELSVLAVGNALKFTVNGTEVANISDGTLQGGGVGVFLGGDNNEAVLTRFAVSQP